jgi:hypothetical protein
MPTQHAELFIALARPFVPPEMKVRNIDGRKESYVTARTVMNRLDNVLGPEAWWDDYTPGEHSVLCRLTIRLPDGQELTKCDAGGYAGMKDQGDDDKSGFSDAFKRAAVKFGVGRHLYRDGVPDFVPVEDLDPIGTSEALHSAEPGANGHPAIRHDEPAPRSGKALYAKLRDLEKQHAVELVKGVNRDGKEAGYPARMVDWSADQASAVWPKVLEFLAGQGVRIVPEAQLQSYRAALWNKCKDMEQARVKDGSQVSQSCVMRCINRLLDAISPGERIERLNELRDKEQLIKLCEMAEAETSATTKGGEV